MRAHEFITEKKNRKRRNKYGVPAYGPGPYGGYGYLAGYSGSDGGGGGGDGGGGGGESIEYNAVEDIDSSIDVAKAISRLPDSRLKDVIEMRFMYDMTYEAIGKELNVGTERARQIVAKAIRHLRHPKYGLTDSTNENFADGKKPGRKGLAKRSGVDCSKSVSDLRKIAKNSGGERQRMAHWCANMKSGRTKKK